MDLTKEELHIIWEAVSQFSENRGTDELGEQLELPAVDALVEKLDAHFTPKETLANARRIAIRNANYAKSKLKLEAYN